VVPDIVPRVLRDRRVGLLIAVLGASLAVGALSLDRSLLDRAHCDGCDPWHPLFVLAPFATGTLLLVAGIGLATVVGGRERR
jgi:hypothetical protein